MKRSSPDTTHVIAISSVEYEKGRLTTSSPDITMDNGNKLVGTTLNFIIDDETRDQDERNDYIEE